MRRNLLQWEAFLTWFVFSIEAQEVLVANLYINSDPPIMIAFRLSLCLLLNLALQLPTLTAEPAARFTITEEADGVTLNLDGKLFTRYLIKSGRRPVLWPVIGPTGAPMTRAFPVARSSTDEAEDHVHHRSIWVGYEGVNEIDYWHEPVAGKERPYPSGEQHHRAFVRTACDGETATIVAKTDWLDHEGKKVCEDERTWTFGTERDQRWLDCRLVLTASEGDLRFADSKEGFFAVRVADSMNVDHHKGGRIISSRGLTNAEAWSKPAEWVDYQGPVAGEKVGIAIFTHPESLNYPTPWHVRTYGLFASNPLGKLAFTDENSDVHNRPPRLTIPKGDSVVLHYRVVLHRGDEKEAKLVEKYADYIAEYLSGK